MLHFQKRGVCDGLRNKNLELEKFSRNLKKEYNLFFLHQAEGVQVVTVCGLQVWSRAVCEDEDPDGRRQQGPREALH